MDRGLGNSFAALCRGSRLFGQFIIVRIREGANHGLCSQV